MCPETKPLAIKMDNKFMAKYHDRSLDTLLTEHKYQGHCFPEHSIGLVSNPLLADT